MRVNVYLSGPVTGADPDKTRELFANAAKKVRNAELNPINPLDYVKPDTDWPTAMKKCLKLLIDSHLIYMLPGWENSKGAKLEYDVAKALEIREVTF